MDIVAGLPLAYFKLETDSSPMNMTQVVLFQKGNNKESVAPSLDAVKYAAMQEVIRNKLLRQRIVESPFHFANPVWLDDPHLDIHHHVQQKVLSCDLMSTQGILEVAADLAADNLDRSSPFWKVFYITFNHGESFAFVCVTHRSLLCRLERTLFDSLFPHNIDQLTENKIDSLTVECPKTGSVFGYNWLPESLPSRNELLNFAKSDWLAIPKQTKAFGSMLVGRWAKRKMASSLVEKQDLPPQWISAPASFFNMPTGQKRSLAYVSLSPQQSRQLLRVFKNCKIRDLILTLITTALQEFMAQLDHHTKDELVALIQSNALSSDPCKLESEEILDDYQLLRLPTNTASPQEQLQILLNRRHKALEFNKLFNNTTHIGRMPSPILSVLINTYEKLGLHHLHKPFCNLVISEQPRVSGAHELNGFNKTEDMSFASLLPHIGLHISFWAQQDSTCITFTTSSPHFEAQDLADAFERSLKSFEEDLFKKRVQR